MYVIYEIGRSIRVPPTTVSKATITLIQVLKLKLMDKDYYKKTK
ncbi:hypothetical protein [Clostridium beijerinckii]|uniref:Uncharacterized protein n=1 Tax=Clostridium beijerinckii TaxID=1520 RepID=A0AAE5LQ79_CLOBE|nr:hypothetical protein [Clostridium beijerinckii]NRT35603.1 hypothetical protein [Clostridium beijerinckii]NRT44969.1 hypothetical protein [Clostridium beijerinckii]NRT72272.1 hypothetical protein [Clostridium beijerinckii]NRZ21036.1 hypothetical protein [Clostridium beijerinckii]NSB14361.1 hypothetical protein [Clostridium beijerinckii]